ncbi:MAG: hypothetical protein RR855_14710 [Comamonas sp.]
MEIFAMRDVQPFQLRASVLLGMFAMLVSGCVTTQPPASTAAASTAASSREAALPASDPKLEQLGQTWEAGLKKGMALVIMAAPGVPVGKELSGFELATNLYSGSAVWSTPAGGRAPAGLPLRVGRYDNGDYLVMLLPAGTYGMTEIWAQMPARKVTDQIATKAPKTRELGTVEFGRGTYTDVVYHSEWRPPTTKVVQQRVQYCTSVYVYMGGCAYIHTDVVDKEVQTAPGYNAVVGEEITDNNALGAHVKLRKPLASITLAPGEVVFTEGLVFSLPGFIGFGERACRETPKKTLRCELNGVAAQTISVAADAFPAKEPLRMRGSTYRHLRTDQPLETLKSIRGLDAGTEYAVSTSMHAVLQRAQYRPLQMHAPQSSKVLTAWRGKGYLLQLSPATVD